jgi:hypothetical protein
MLTILSVRNGGSVVALALACAGALVLAGCSGDDGIGKRFPVSGKVTYDGKPLPTGTVNFLPEDPKTGRPATGEIQSDGSYTLTTQTPGDGAMGGKYKVAISAYSVDASKTASPPQGGTADQVVVAQAQGKSLIPIKYTGTDTSGLTATVGPGSTSFDFDLKPE